MIKLIKIIYFYLYKINLNDYIMKNQRYNSIFIEESFTFKKKKKNEKTRK